MAGNSRFAVSLHILAYLTYREGRSVSSAEIASSVDTNAVVIRRLLSALVRARIVQAQKGAAGGFMLAKTPQSVSLLDIYRAVEPEPDVGMRHFAPNQKCPSGAKIESVVRGIFDRVQASMEAELRDVTLAQLHEQLHAVCPGKR